MTRQAGDPAPMSAEDYESLQETLYLLSTHANATHLLRGLAEARDGRAEPTDVDALAIRFDGRRSANSTREAQRR
jgi:PHD/YefM family antitoxin component YafN of YafNO toxin-antitoxin module